jgi:hypothetical protein
MLIFIASALICIPTNTVFLASSTAFVVVAFLMIAFLTDEMESQYSFNLLSLMANNVEHFFI